MDTPRKLLKRDLFGEVWLLTDPAGSRILRDTRNAARLLRPLARYLLRREAAVLAVLPEARGLPSLLAHDTRTLQRSYLDGAALQQVKIKDNQYFIDAAKLLRKLHSANIVHNDLAKEPNLLVLEDSSPAFIDYQLALYQPRRGRLFRILAREDLRHLLKHKRSYCPQYLSRRELNILATPAPLSVLYMKTIKPVYCFITRRVLGWSDREGASDRGAQH